MKPKNIKRLIPLSDYVLRNKAELEGYSTKDYKDFSYNLLIEIENYAKFLKQPLELSFFIPCDENGDIIEEPICEKGCGCSVQWDGDDCVTEYNKAKEKVLFKGFNLTQISCGQKTLKLNDEDFAEFYDFKVWCGFADYKTIEDLVHLNLELC